MIGPFVRYHMRPAARYYTRGVTPLTVIGAVTIVGLFATAYGSYFTAVRRGLIPVDMSLHHLRALTLEFVVGFLVAGLRKRQGVVTFFASTPLRPADALRLLLLTNGGKPFVGEVVFIAFVLPFVLRLSPSIERAFLHVASDAVAVVLHYLAATVIAALWQRRRKDGTRAAAVFMAFVGVEFLVFRQWPDADFVLLPVNIAACVACWTVVIGHLHPTRLQRFLISAVPRRGGRSTLNRMLHPLPVETKLYVKECLMRPESALAVLTAAGLFTGLIVALILGIPDETRTTTVIACMYAAAGFGAAVLERPDRAHMEFFKTTPATFGRLTVGMLAPHCAGYLLAAAIVGAVGAAGGMRLGALLILLTQGVFVALVTWLIPFRFLFSSKLFVLLASGLIHDRGIRVGRRSRGCPGRGTAGRVRRVRGADSRDPLSGGITQVRGFHRRRLGLHGVIELVGAGKTFGNGKGVFDVDLRLKGGLTGFLGRNGSGKTTTMRLIMGLLEPDGGTVLVDGHDLWKYDHIYTLKRHLGFLPNDDYFFPRLTGRENLEYLSLLKTGDRGAYAALDRFIAELEADAFIDDPFDSYSTGMKKKAQLVGALIGEPANILLDEPHNGLDILANIAVNRTLLKLRGEGRTVFVSSHLAEVFDTIADALVVIDQGRIAAQHRAPFRKKPVDLYLDAIGASGEASPPA